MLELQFKLSELAMELPGDGLLYIRWHQEIENIFFPLWFSDLDQIQCRIDKGVGLSSDHGQVR